MTLLAIELSSLKPDAYLPIITQTLEAVESHLYIVIFLTPDLLPKLDSPAKRAGHFHPLQDLISALYICTASKTEIPCDIIFADWCGYDLAAETWEYSILSLPDSSPEIVSRLPKSTMSVRTITYLNDPEILKESTLTPSNGREHAVVVVGGTFDHLHPGHKILLSLAAFIASRRFVCGVTDDALLKNKRYAEFLEPISLRIENVRKFLMLIARQLELTLVPIHDIYGPTAYDPEISAIVISEETRAGAESVNKLRKEKDLQQLEMFVIDVIGEEKGKVGLENMAQDKMSSTKIRERLAKRS